MRTRLLHILEEGIGGAERLVLDLTRHLNLEKYDITVAIIGQEGCVTDLIDRKKVRVLEFNCRSGFDILAMRSVFAFLFSHQFDIIHIHQRSILTNFALLAVRPRPVLVYHEHGALLRGSLKTRLFYKVFHRFYDVFITMNKEMSQCMMRTVRVPNDKIVIVKNSVDVDYFKPSNEVKRKSSVCKNHPTIGTIARLVPEKDLDLFLETARLVIRTLPDIRFVIVGDGPLRESIEKVSNKPELKGKVIILGVSSEVPNVLRSFDLFFFTSRIEAFGLTLIESLASGVPVVCAMPEAGGARALLEELPGVCLVRERVPEPLARAVIDLIEDPVSMRSMGQAGRTHVVANYSVTDWIESIDSLYDHLLKGRKELSS